jgi:hypothetical protein
MADRGMSKAEIQAAILSDVATRFVNLKASTARRDLVVKYRDTEALTDLVNGMFLRPKQSGQQEYLPTAAAFQLCDNSELRETAKFALTTILHVLQNMAVGDPKDVGYSFDDLKRHVNDIYPNRRFDDETLKLGLYLARDFGVLGGLRNNPDETEITWFQISETAITMRDLDSQWDLVTARYQIPYQSVSPPPSDEGSPSASPSPKSDAPDEGRRPFPPPDTANIGVVEVAIRALSDKPSDIDLLEFKDYAQALTDFIKNEKTQTPLTIGIDGAWGSGKTTLMKMIQSRLALKEKTPTDRLQTRTVWFNAWKYDQEESLWASLALEILSQVRRQCYWCERVSLWIRVNWKRFDKGKFGGDLLKFIVYPAALVLATALGTFLWKRWMDASFDIAKWTKVAVGGGLIATFLGALRQIHDQIVAPFELNISKYMRTPDYKTRIGFLGEFEKDFKLVIDAVTNNGKSSLVIFVDDLDRCEPAKPVNVIEAINHLLDAEPCVFVMGMDVRSVAASIEAKYKDLAQSSIGGDLSSGLPLGYRFLEKIVQVPFRLPQVGRESLARLVTGNLDLQPDTAPDHVASVAEAERLIKSEEDKGENLEEAVAKVSSERPDVSEAVLMEAKQNVFARTFDDDEEVCRGIGEVLPYLEANARKVKRFINLFRLQLLIANRRGLLESGDIEIVQLARWVVLIGSWPEIIDVLNDPTFASRLTEAHQVQRAPINELGREQVESRKTILDAHLADSRIKRYINDSSLIDLLQALVSHRRRQLKDLPTLLAPYLQLSSIARRDKD